MDGESSIKFVSLKPAPEILYIPMLPVPYPELFCSWYTGLGSQIQTPKRSKVLISGVSFPQRFLSQSQESNVLSYSERKLTKNFQGFAPGPHWGELTALPQSPQLHIGFSSFSLVKKPVSPKNCWIQQY